MDVEELLARETIRTVLLRHFRAADRADRDLCQTAWWPDGRFIGGPVEGTATEWLGALFEGLPASYDVLMHYIANMLITVEGSRGLAELYGIGYHLIVDDPDVLKAVMGDTLHADIDQEPGERYEMWVGVRYAVEMQRREGAWRILTMQPIIEWSRVQRYAGIGEGGVPAAMPTPAARDGSDATYFEGAFAP